MTTIDNEIKCLQQQMAMIDMKETTRKSKELAMPDPGNARAFERIAIDITGRKVESLRL
jgi:hypothetical protein